MSVRGRILLGLALAAGMVWYLWPALDVLRPGLEDEGDFVQAAHRVLMGQIPYRDFFWFVPPGGFYALAGWLAVAGDHFASVRWFMAAVAAVNVLLLYGIGLRVLPPWGAAVAAAAYGWTAVPAWPVASHHWVAETFFLLTVGCVAGHVESGRRGWLWGTGLCAGLAAAVLQAEGAACVLLLVLYFAACALGAVKRPVGPADAAGVAGGALAVGIPVAAYMAAQHALGPMWRDVVEYALGPARVFNRHPFHGFPLGAVLDGWRAVLSLPPLEWLHQAPRLVDFATWPLMLFVEHTLFFPLVAGFGAIAWRWRAKAPVLLLLAIAQACIAATVLSRPDQAHVGYVRSLFWILLVWVLMTLRWRRSAWVAAGLVLMVLVTQAVARRGDFTSPANRVAFSRGTVRVADAGYAAALRDLERIVSERTRPGDPIFVYPIFSLLYYFTGRTNPTPYDRLVPYLSSPAHVAAVEAAARAGAFRMVVLMPLDVEVYLAGYPTVDRAGFARENAAIRAALRQAMPGRCVVVGGGVQVR